MKMRMGWFLCVFFFNPSFHVMCQNTNSSVNISLDPMSLLKARVLSVHPVICKGIIRISDDVVTSH